MKKSVILSIVATATFLLGTSTLRAQSKMSLGLKGGVNSTFYQYDSESDYSKSSPGLGASVGGFLKYDFGKWFALQTDLMFNYRNSELSSKFTSEKSKLESYDLEVPVYAVFQFNMGTGKLFFGVGPYIGYGFSAKTESLNMYSKNTEGKTAMKPLNYGAATMLGYELGHFQINASYMAQNGIGAINNSPIRRQTFGLGIGYKL